MVVLRSHKTQSFDWDSARKTKICDLVFYLETLRLAFAQQLRVAEKNFGLDVVIRSKYFTSDCG